MVGKKATYGRWSPASWFGVCLSLFIGRQKGREKFSYIQDRHCPGRSIPLDAFALQSVTPWIKTISTAWKTVQNNKYQVDSIRLNHSLLI